jgi:hypothetical protein
MCAATSTQVFNAGGFTRMLARQPRFPVTRSPMCVRNGHDDGALAFDTIDHAEGKAIDRAAAATVMAHEPCRSARRAAG